jgi:hypothetical protein
LRQRQSIASPIDVRRIVEAVIFADLKRTVGSVSAPGPGMRYLTLRGAVRS